MDAMDAVLGRSRGHEAEQGPPPDLALIGPALTEVHELDHYRVLQSTPFGLLYWRLWQCLAVNLSFIDRRIAAVVPDALADGGDLLGKAAQAASDRMPRGRDRDFFISVVQESLVYQLMIQWLDDGRGVTVSEFVLWANVAFQLLAIRSEVPVDSLPRWTTRRAPDEALLPEDALTAVELLEAGARARELVLLNELRAEDETIKAWREQRIHGIYRAGFVPLLRRLGEPSWIRLVVDVAFSADLDLTAAGPELVVEDCLPALRAPRLVEALRNTVLRNTLDSYRAVVGEGLAECAGLHPPRLVYARLARLERLFGEGANFGGRLLEIWDSSGSKIPFSAEFAQEASNFLGTSAYFEVTHSRFRAAFAERHADPIRFLRSDRANPIAPLIIYLQDTCIFNWQLAGEDVTLLQTHVNMIVRRMMQHILFDTPLEGLRTQHEAFRHALAAAYAPDSSYIIDVFDAFYGLEAQLNFRFNSAGVHRRLARALDLGSLEAVSARWRAALLRMRGRQVSSGSSR